MLGSGRRKKRANLNHQLPSVGDLDTTKTDDEESYGMKDLHNGLERRKPRKKLVSPSKEALEKFAEYVFPCEALLRAIGDLATSGSKYLTNNMKGRLFKKRPYLYTMHLLKKDNELGLEIAGGRGSKYGDVGIYVAGIIHGSNADKDGRIRRGDEILSINKRELHDLTVHQVRDLLASCDHVVRLKLASKHLNKDAVSTESLSRLQTEQDRPVSPSFVFDLILAKDASGRGLGFSIMDGSETGKRGIFVKNIFVPGVAYDDGTLKRGDEIVMVNGKKLAGEPYLNAMCMIKNAAQGPVRFQIRRRKNSERSESTSSTASCNIAPVSPLTLSRTISAGAGTFHRQGSDRSIERGQPLYFRNRKPPLNFRSPNTANSPSNPTPDSKFKDVLNVIVTKNQMPMTSSLNRLHRNQSMDSNGSSCSSIDSCTSAPITRTKSPIPRMGVSVKRRKHQERNEQMALQRRSQSENDLRLMTLYMKDAAGKNSADSLDGETQSMPYYVDRPQVSYKPRFSPACDDYENFNPIGEKREYGFSPIKEGNLMPYSEIDTGPKSLPTFQGDRGRDNAREYEEIMDFPEVPPEPPERRSSLVGRHKIIEIRPGTYQRNEPKYDYEPIGNFPGYPSTDDGPDVSGIMTEIPDFDTETAERGSSTNRLERTSFNASNSPNSKTGQKKTSNPDYADVRKTSPDYANGDGPKNSKDYAKVRKPSTQDYENTQTVEDYEEPISYRDYQNESAFSVAPSTKLNRHRHDLNLPGSSGSGSSFGSDVTSSDMKRFPVTHSSRYEYV